VASADRIVELLDREDRIPEAASPAPVPRGPLGLHFQGVGFTGDGDRALLEGIDLEIPQASTVAIVGPTGCGKSTLVSLIPRFHDPDAGRILLEGRDLREYPVRELRSVIALVFQETFLFSASVAENIAFGVPGASEERIREAARQAQALDFIEQLPEGFQTRVGERGVTLSGGQKQRLAIARAYLTDPAILIMDDATSSVDSRTERGLQEATREVARGRTTILIAQRFSTLQHADHIYVLEEGRVIEQGTHAGLVAAGGLYQDLHRRQQVFAS
jgi:ABC-type multidrug transport system fused ATPase/permease subunit